MREGRASCSWVTRNQVALLAAARDCVLQLVRDKQAFQAGYGDNVGGPDAWVPPPNQGLRLQGISLHPLGMSS